MTKVCYKILLLLKSYTLAFAYSTKPKGGLSLCSLRQLLSKCTATNCTLPKIREYSTESNDVEMKLCCQNYVNRVELIHCKEFDGEYTCNFSEFYFYHFI